MTECPAKLCFRILGLLLHRSKVQKIAVSCKTPQPSFIQSLYQELKTLLATKEKAKVKSLQVLEEVVTGGGSRQKTPAAPESTEGLQKPRGGERLSGACWRLQNPPQRREPLGWALKEGEEFASRRKGDEREYQVHR